MIFDISNTRFLLRLVQKHICNIIEEIVFNNFTFLLFFKAISCHSQDRLFKISNIIQNFDQKYILGHILPCTQNCHLNSNSTNCGGEACAPPHVLGYNLTLFGPRGQIMPSILLRAPPHLFGRCGMSEGLLTKVFSSVLNIMYFFFTQNNTNSFSRDFLIRVFIILIHIVIWPQKFLWGPGVKSNKYF